MEYTIKEQDGVQVVAIQGKIMGGPEEKRLIELKNNFVTEGKIKVVFDLSEVDWVNSLGIGLFIGTMTTLKNKGGDLRLANVPKPVYTLIDKCRLTSILNSFPTVEDAVNSFK